MGIRDVLAVPREKVIYFPNNRHCDVQCVTNFIFGNVTTVEIELREIQTGLGEVERLRP